MNDTVRGRPDLALSLVRWLLRPREVPSLLWLIFGTAILGLALLPSVLVPVFSDDLPQFLHMAQYHGSWSSVLADSGVTHQNRFDPLGIGFNRFYGLVAYEISGLLRVDPTLVYRAGTGILAWITVAAAAYAWQRAMRFAAPGFDPRFAPSFCGLAVVIAATLQIHAGFSIDPTIAISQIGYPVTALSLLLIGMVLSGLSVGDPIPAARLTAICAVSLVGVLFYEQAFAAVLAIALLTALLVVTKQWVWGWPSLAGLIAAVAVIPAGVGLVGRLWSNSAGAVAYAGTQPEFGPQSFAAFGRLILSAVPGSAWPLSQAYTGAHELPAAFYVFPLALVFLSATAIALLASSQKSKFVYGPRTPILAIAGLAWLSSSVAMHAFTAKYSVGVTSVGMVYMSYVTTFIFVAMLMLSVAARVEWRRTSRPLLVLPVVLLTLTVAQNVVNWQVSSANAHERQENSSLLRALMSPDTEHSERCRALAEWSRSAPASAYYRKRVIDGTNLTLKDRFGEPPC